MSVIRLSVCSHTNGRERKRQRQICNNGTFSLFAAMINVSCLIVSHLLFPSHFFLLCVRGECVLCSPRIGSWGIYSNVHEPRLLNPIPGQCYHIFTRLNYHTVTVKLKSQPLYRLRKVEFCFSSTTMTFSAFDFIFFFIA